MVRHAWLGDRVVPLSSASVSLEDRGLQFGESLYEVVAVTGSKARLLAEHAARMQAGAEILDIAAGVPDPAQFQHIVDELQERDRVKEGLLYAQVTGGTAPRAHLPEAEQRPQPTFFAYLTRYRFPRDADVQRGIAVTSQIDPRWAHRDLKTTMLLPAVLAKKAARARGAEEALFVGSDGFVHEGASSNVVAVEGRNLVTPAQSPELLPGTTRPLVGALASEAGLTMIQERLTLERLRAADELFVTSTTWLVMPVVRVDDCRIGQGVSGSVAVDLARRMRHRLDLDT